MKNIFKKQMKNRYLIYVILCSYFLGAFFGVFNTVSASEYIIDSSVSPSLFPNDGSNIVRLSNGTLYCFYYDSGTIEAKISLDNGVTWIAKTAWNIAASSSPCLTVSSLDNVTIFYNGAGSSIRYTYIQNNVKSSEKISPSTGYLKGLYIDGNDDLIYTYNSLSYIYCVKYTPDLRTFTSSIYVGSAKNYNPGCVFDSNNNFYIGYIEYSNKLNIKKLSFGTSTFSTLLNTSVTITYGNVSIYVDSSDGLHVAYENTPTDICYRYSSDRTSFSSEEKVYSDTSYVVNLSFIRVDSSNKIYVFYSTKFFESSSFKQVRYRYKTISSSWGTNYTLTTGSYNYYYPKAVGSVYPSFNKIGDGLSLYYHSSNIIYYNNNIFNSWYLTTSSYGCYDEGSGYSIKGSYDLDNPYTHAGSDNKVIEQKYDIAINTVVRGVDLVVSKYQLTYMSNDVNDYYLFVNGINCTSPDSIEFLIGDKYIISWCGLSVSISDKILVFEFVSRKKATTWSGHTNLYWDVGVLYFDGDVDGGINFGTGNTLPDGKWNPSTYSIYKTLGCELAYKFYTDPIIVTDKPEYGFNLITSLSNSVLTNETIQVQYFLNNSYGGSINVYKIGIGTVSLNLKFPKNVQNSFGEVSMFFNSTGTYILTLRNYLGDNVSNFQISVTNNNNNYYIFSYPNPSKQGEKVTFYYKFFNKYGYDGLIILTNVKESSNSTTQNIYQRIIIPCNSTGNFTYTFQYPVTVYYANMYMSVSGQYSFLTQYVHYLETPTNKFSLRLDSYEYVLLTTTKFYYVTINYETAYQCEGIHIYHDGNLIRSNAGIFKSGRFSENITKITSGFHNITMVLTTHNGSVTLCYVNYKVSVNDLSGGDVDNSLFIISPPFSYFTGVFTVVLLTLTPIFFGFIFKLNLDNIPQFLYLVFASIGFIISILLNFFPAWSVLVLIVVGIFIVFIMWQQKKIA